MAEPGPRPRRLTWGAVLAMALLAVACSDEEPGAGFSMPPEVRRTTPTALRTIDGPPADQLARDTSEVWYPEYHVAALGTDEVVVGAFDGVRPGAWFVASLADGDWEAIDPPPVGGEMIGEVTTVGQDLVLVGAPCPADMSPEADTDPTCPPGYDGMGFWRLDHRDRSWSEVALVTSDELTEVTGNQDIGQRLLWSSSVLGVVEDAVVVNVLSTLLTVDMDGEATFRSPTLPEPGGPTHCVTGNGAIVASGPGGSMGSSGTEVTSLDEAPLAVLGPDDDAWALHDAIPITRVNSVACGEDQVSILGETDVTLEQADWRVVDLDGRTVAREPLPAEATLGPHTDPTTASFIDRHLFPVGEGGNDLAVVRDFGHRHEVLVLTGPGAPALVQRHPTGGEVEVEGATALPDGRIATLVHRRTGGGVDRFELLVAD